MVSEKTSEKIRALAFLMVLLVVAIHCFSLPYELRAVGWGVSTWIVMLQTVISNGVARLAVPFFFIVSGFFLTKGWNSGQTLAWWHAACRKRVWSLWAPFSLWSVLYFCGKWGLGKFDGDWCRVLGQIGGWNLACDPVALHLWFVRMVMLLVLISPSALLVLQSFWGGFGLVTLCGVCWFGGVKFPCPVGDYGCLLFFWGGLWMGLHRARVIPLVKVCQERARYLLLMVFAGSLMAVVWCAVEGSAAMFGLPRQLMILSGLGTTWFFSDELVRVCGWCRGWFGLTFFVYAFHVMLVSVSYKFLQRVLSPELYHGVGYLLKIAFVCCGSVAVGAVLRKKLPRAYSLLCGGR